jgi:methyl-accepting chemotaxis protein
MSPVVLVVLIAWALLSVLFLTGTLLAARSIDRSVAVIKPQVVEIGDEAGFIRQAKTIAAATVKIRAAAEPLSGHLARTLTTAQKGIDPKLKSILGKVGNINETAGSINTTVLQIGTTVDGIFASANAINGSVKSIAGSANSINRDTKTINASARDILGSAGGILSRVNSIDRAVATIVGQANTILDVAPAIGKDLNTVRGLVGNGNQADTIRGHANAIDCSPLLVSPLAVQGLPSALSDLLKPLLGSLTKGGAASIACGS